MTQNINTIVVLTDNSSSIESIPAITAASAITYGSYLALGPFHKPPPVAPLANNQPSISFPYGSYLARGVQATIALGFDRNVGTLDSVHDQEAEARAARKAAEAEAEAKRKEEAIERRRQWEAAAEAKFRVIRARVAEQERQKNLSDTAAINGSLQMVVESTFSNATEASVFVSPPKVDGNEHANDEPLVAFSSDKNVSNHAAYLCASPISSPAESLSSIKKSRSLKEIKDVAVPHDQPVDKAPSLAAAAAALSPDEGMPITSFPDPLSSGPPPIDSPTLPKSEESLLVPSKPEEERRPRSSKNNTYVTEELPASRLFCICVIQ